MYLHSQDTVSLFANEHAGRAAPIPNDVAEAARAQVGPKSTRHRVINFNGTAILDDPETLVLNFFDDKSFMVKKEKMTKTSNGEFTQWIGIIEEDPANSSVSVDASITTAS